MTDPTGLLAWAEAVQTGGPYLLLVVLAWALWKRDRELYALYGQIVDLSRARAQADVALAEALTDLKAVVERVAERRR